MLASEVVSLLHNQDNNALLDTKAVGNSGVQWQSDFDSRLAGVRPLFENSNLYRLD